MKIISDFKDYYDSVAQSGFDASVVYNRQIWKVQLDNPPFAQLPAYLPKEGDNRPYHEFNLMLSNGNLQHTCFKIIGFCGKLYVGLFSPKHDGNDFAEAHSSAIFGKDILELPWSKKSMYRDSPPKVMIENCLEQYHEKEYDAYFKTLNCPVFEIDLRHPLSQYETKNKGLYLPYFICNPPLSSYQFYKIIDPFSAFQQVQSYLSGVLGVDAVPTVEISNNSKIEKAGFDKKTSFRKDKTDKFAPK